MSEKPLITIIMTTLNSARYLSRAIESCLGQTYRNIELVVVDGGSTDSTLSLVYEAMTRDPRIKVVYQESNLGRLPGALNLGMESASGDFLTWTQDDCWYMPNAIEAMADYLSCNTDVDLVYCDFWTVDLIRHTVSYFEVSKPDKILWEDVIQQCFLFRRQVYETVGPQDPIHFPVHEVPWRIKVAQQFAIAPLHTPLMFYLVQKRSLTGRLGGYEIQRQVAQVIYREGHISAQCLGSWLAQIDIDEAYAAFVLAGDFATFHCRVATGILRDWAWLGDRGLFKMLVLSLLPLRGKLREAIYAQWITDEQSRQSRLRDLHAAELPSIPWEWLDAQS